MPLVNTTDLVEQTISYAAWKARVSLSKIRYITIPLTSKYLASFGRLGMFLTTHITASADITDFETNYLPTASLATDEVELFELVQLDATIGKIDGRQQKAYDISDTYIYIGFATVGLSQSAVGWTIKKLVLDSSGNPTSEKWTAVETAIWTNRTSETYS